MSFLRYLAFEPALLLVHFSTTFLAVHYLADGFCDFITCRVPSWYHLRAVVNGPLLPCFRFLPYSESTGGSPSTVYCIFLIPYTCLLIPAFSFSCFVPSCRLLFYSDCSLLLDPDLELPFLPSLHPHLFFNFMLTLIPLCSLSL